MKKTFLLAVMALNVSLLMAQSNTRIPTAVQSAIIFQNGSELTHVAKANLSAGTHEVVLEGLNASLHSNSLQIKCSGGATVLSSVFSADYLTSKSLSALLKKLKDSVEVCEKDLQALSTKLKINEDMTTVLQSNKVIAGTQNGLDVAELVKLMDYYKIKMEELSSEKDALKSQQKSKNEQLKKLRSQLNQEQGRRSKSLGKLTLNITCPVATSYDFTVTYYTRQASWTPYYDIQASAANSSIKMVCKARFSQNTDLDWKNVQISLSTSTPSNNKEAPQLSTWFLNYVTPAARARESNVAIMGYVAEDEDVVIGYGTQTKKSITGSVGAVKESKPLYIVNGEEMNAYDAGAIDPSLIKNVEVLKDASASAVYGAKASNGVVVITLKQAEDFVSTKEAADITYNLETKYDLAGNGKEQIVTLRTLDVPANYEWYCAPKLDKNVFTQVNIADWEKLNLLQGYANITNEGTYVGQSFINPQTTLSALKLTLGVDKRIVVKREKMQDFSSVKFLGNDRKQVFTYQITVRNNKNQDVSLALKEQCPISTQKDIEVEVLDVSGAEYDKNTGMVEWKLDLKSGEMKTLKLSYSVKCPKNKMLNL